MPGNKRPNRKPGVKKTTKSKSKQAAAGGDDPNLQDTKPAANTYGSPKSGRSALSPTMNQRSARSR